MMMPSRGLVSAAGAARQAARLNRRFISTTPPRNIQAPLRQTFASGLLQKSSPWRSGRLASASAISLASQSRLASTNATTSNEASAASTPGPLDTAAADVSSSFDISNIGDSYLTGVPETIGYLKEIGLDYGWGPTATIEWGMEHIHVYTGLPWWASIMATALCFRLALLPLFKKSSDVGARQAAMMPVTKPLNTKMMAAMKAGDNDTAAKMRQQLKEINARAGISLSAMFVPPILQGVFGFCAFKLMRAMANLPVPGLETGGLLWITDLTQADPYLALPAIMALSMHVVFRFGGESGAPMQNPAMKPVMLYVMPGLIFISTLWMPANLDLWLATTGVTGIGQVLLFKQPGVRRALGMSPLVPTDPRSPQSSESKPTGNTIDVKATSRSVSGDAGSIRYQAPNIKRASSGASQFDTPEAELPKPDFVTRTKSKFNNQMKTMQEGIKTFRDNTAASAARYSGNNKKESKTRSKEFLKQAEAYEKRWQNTHGKKQ